MSNKWVEYMCFCAIPILILSGCIQDNSPDKISVSKKNKRLKKAITSINIKKIIKHVKNGADVNIRNDSGYYPLHIAASKGKIGAVKYLVRKGAEIDAISFPPQKDDRALVLGDKFSGLTPLHMAALYGQTEVVKYLLKKGANPNFSQPEAGQLAGHTPLYEAAYRGYKQIVKALLENAAEVNVKIKNNWTAADYAKQIGYDKIVKMLKEFGAKPKKEIKPQPLHAAALKGNFRKVKSLLQQTKFNLNKIPDTGPMAGWTPLHLAAQKGHLKIAKYLIEHGANSEARAKENQTPLYSAASEGNLGIVKLLIERGVKVDPKASRGFTPLVVAAAGGRAQIVEELIKSGADLNIEVSESGWSPLHWAVHYGHLEVIKVLIKNGADPSDKTERGLTPLELADKRNRTEIKKYFEAL